MTPQEARSIQESLRSQVIFKSLDHRRIHTVAAVDQSYDPRDRQRVFAVAVAFSFPDLQLVDRSLVEDRVMFPYIPGLLSFRETPSLLKALRQLGKPPDAILVDAQGYAHPRRFGAACHLGVLSGIPTIGCAKTRLLGTYEEPAPHRGAFSPLMDGSEQIGVVLRTRDKVAPVFVSVGHLVDLSSAMALVLATTPRYRIPEPLRTAHILANAARRLS